MLGVLNARLSFLLCRCVWVLCYLLSAMVCVCACAQARAHSWETSVQRPAVLKPSGASLQTKAAPVCSVRLRSSDCSLEFPYTASVGDRDWCGSGQQNGVCFYSQWPAPPKLHFGVIPFSRWPLAHVGGHFSSIVKGSRPHSWVTKAAFETLKSQMWLAVRTVPGHQVPRGTVLAQLRWQCCPLRPTFCSFMVYPLSPLRDRSGQDPPLRTSNCQVPPTEHSNCHNNWI